MKCNRFLTIAAALCMPMAALAQNAANNAEAPARVIPKVEFSVGGGAGIGGYHASFPGDPWLTHLGQSDDILQDYMKFYLPSASLRPAGHVGLYLDFNFTEHWGLHTGAELGIYSGVIQSENMLTTTTNVATTYGANGDAYQKKVWIGSNLPDFVELHKMYAVQIPLMLKYMTPVSPAGHQFYIAGGAKIGIPVMTEYSQRWDNGKYDVFGFSEGDDFEFLATYNSGHTKILPSMNYGTESGSGRSASFVPEDASWNLGWTKIQASPIDVAASIDLGLRWNLGKGLGLYTGLYCDYGLLRPIARAQGNKVLNFDSESIILQPASQNFPLVSLEGSEKTSVLAADAPSYAYYTGEQMEDFHFSDNDAPYAKSLHKLQAGVKIRFSFGRVSPRAKKARSPKVKPVKEPEKPVVPEGIQRTMIRLSNTLFAFDKFNLSSEARVMLDEVAAWLKQNPELKVEIGGHTDDRGSDEYNQRLSENRAKSVYDYFVQSGVDASRLSYKGYGESRPIATNETEEGRQANRRVELQIVR